MSGGVEETPANGNNEPETPDGTDLSYYNPSTTGSASNEPRIWYESDGPKSVPPLCRFTESPPRPRAMAASAGPAPRLGILA